MRALLAHNKYLSSINVFCIHTRTSGILLSGVILGFKVQSFKIMPLGFMVSFKIDTKNYNKKIIKANLLVVKKLIVAIAGPLINLILIVIFILLNKEKIFTIPTELLFYANILIFLFNMLPIYPLDGGRIIKNILHIFCGKINSLEITNLSSNIFAMLLTLTTIYLIFITRNILYLFMIVYIWVLIIRKNKLYKLKIKMYKILQNHLENN